MLWNIPKKSLITLQIHLIIERNNVPNDVYNVEQQKKAKENNKGIKSSRLLVV